MVFESSAICARSVRILSGSGSSSRATGCHQPLPLVDVENEIGPRPRQPLRRRSAVEISRDELLPRGG
jgi:hypothetical protein